MTLWRVFPWDPGRRPGEPFSPSWIPSATGRGRFDLPSGHSPVLYLAETADHAVGEALQPWRGRPLRSAHLKRTGLALSLVGVELDGLVWESLADLCDASLLSEVGIQPDRLASRHRELTQPLAAAVWERGYSGLRWLSSFWGDWHTVVLFIARAGQGLRFHNPEALNTQSPPVVEAARLLGMEVG